MDILQKNKLLFWCVIILVILNFVSVGTFWFGMLRPPMPPPMDGKGPGRMNIPPDEFLLKELGLNPQQMEQFKKAQLDHFTAIKSIIDSVHTLKRNAFKELTSEVPDKDKAITLLNSAERFMAIVDSMTFTHFSRLRSICNARQREKLDKFLNDVFVMMPPPRVEPGPMPGNGADRPPERR